MGLLRPPPFFSLLGDVLRGRSTADPRTWRLAAAARRLDRASDLDEIARIARVETMALARADHGIYIGMGATGLTPMGVPDPGFDPDRLGDGALGCIATDGDTLNVVVRDEPGIALRTASVLAVPVQAGGSLVGIVALAKANSEGFSADEVRLVEALAPTIGSAASSAQPLDDSPEAPTDALTGLPTRFRLDHDLDHALSSLSPGSLLAVGMLDVDHFSVFNETHGREAGDQVLQMVADVLVANLREGDRAYRYGGEEFSLILHVRSCEEAIEAAERLRRTIESSQIDGASTQPLGCLSVSVGLATVGGGSPRSALSAADAALYAAKSGGRNRVEVVERPWHLHADTDLASEA